MKLLDLFCGAGGAGEGYARAGFDVTGIDIRRQPRNLHWSVQADALEYLAAHGHEFDVIHASPPCQAFSIATLEKNRGKHLNLIPETRALLECIGCPYVIENVPGAPLLNPIMLCGTMFGLGVFRHRLFESNLALQAPAHRPHDGMIGDGRYFSVAGGAGRWRSWGTVKRDVNKGSVAEWRHAMGIDWMTRQELTQAIPPAYTQFIGQQLMQLLRRPA